MTFLLNLILGWPCSHCGRRDRDVVRHYRICRPIFKETA